jgi:hypothetical protein
VYEQSLGSLTSLTSLTSLDQLGTYVEPAAACSFAFLRVSASCRIP